MASATLPRDTVGAFIQALAPGASANTAVSGASARVALPVGVDCVRIGTDTDCYVKFGTSSVAATTADMLFVKGAEVFRVPASATHVAFLQLSAGGVASVTAMV